MNAATSELAEFGDQPRPESATSGSEQRSVTRPLRHLSFRAECQRITPSSRSLLSGGTPLRAVPAQLWQAVRLAAESWRDHAPGRQVGDIDCEGVLPDEDPFIPAMEGEQAHDVQPDPAPPRRVLESPGIRHARAGHERLAHALGDEQVSDLRCIVPDPPERSPPLVRRLDERSPGALEASGDG